MGNLAIYATKGFEYILILSFLAAFTIFFLYFTSKKFQHDAGAVGQMLSDFVEWFRVPENVLFHQGHAWARTDASAKGKTVRVGLDDFTQKMVGKIDKIETGKIGDEVTQGHKGWSLKVGDKNIDMLSPVSGKIVEINPKISGAKSVSINNDPFEDGWIMKVKPDNFQRDSSHLLSGKLAKKWMEDVTDKLHDKMSPELGMVYQDGGVPVAGMARSLDEKNWDKLVREFLLT